MNVVYKNKYKAIGILQRRLSIYHDIGRTILWLSIALSGIGFMLSPVRGAMILLACTVVWCAYRVFSTMKSDAVNERINTLLDYNEENTSEVSMTLLPEKKGKFALGVDIDGCVHRVKFGTGLVPITVDCVTGVATVAKEAVGMLSNGR